MATSGGNPVSEIDSAAEEIAEHALDDRFRH